MILIALNHFSGSIDLSGPKLGRKVSTIKSEVRGYKFVKEQIENGESFYS